MRVARLNFSHGDHEYFKKVIFRIRKVNPDIAILLDTKGPEIRSGEVENGEITLSDRDELILTSKQVLGNNKILTINYSKIDTIKKNSKVLIDDGLIEAKVLGKVKEGIKVKIENGGKLGSRKTIALNNHNPQIQFLSKKDVDDIKFGIEYEVDFIAASFVRTVEDVLSIRNILNKVNSKIRFIAKIEHPLALKNLKGIIENSQGIMIARGDLGVEVPMEKVPKIQKDIIHRCNELGKPVIVATQMLESMKENPRPTRAEISDVAQAIIDGTDAIMLSGETASGKYPVKSVKMMATIAHEYEDKTDRDIHDDLHSKEELIENSISMFVTRAAYLASKTLKNAVIITPTESGYTARKVSRFKPKCPIIAVTRDKIVQRQLELSRGVFAFYLNKKYSSVDNMIYQIIKFIYDKKMIKKTDKVIITSGHTLSTSGHTNSVEIYKVQKVIENIENKKRK
jgi:pyruvate kinase